jgi:hypothetical protein
MSSILLGNRVSEAEVIAVPEVQWTRSFHPVHHRDIIKVIKNSIKEVGLEIRNAEYVLAQKGMQLFSVYDLSHSNNEMMWSIGLRNSLNKSLSFSVTAGTRVFVCSNLCFSGTYMAVRKHTCGMDTDTLAVLAYRTMQMIIPQLRAFQAWHEGLKNVPLLEADAKLLLVEIMTNGVLAPSKFHQFMGLYANVYDDSVWGFHEAVTDILKNSNLLVLPQKNKLLNQTIDNYIGSLTATNDVSSLGDFYQQRSKIHS